ncbi:MAG: molybdate ABC transporter substrate-binding protein [Actinomycetota bacterium]
MTNLDTKQPNMLRKGVLCVVLAAGVLSANATITHATSRATSSTAQGSITVSAAASLTDAFGALAREFRKEHPKVRLRFNFGSSSALVSQIQAGAPADVFAAADTSSVDKLAASGQVNKAPRIFARNSLQIAVKPGNPLKITSLADLSKARVVALCAKTVPCGVYAASALQRAVVVLPESSISRGVDAKATIGAVVNGDADAAVVYTTDVLAAGRSVAQVTIPKVHNVTAMYSIAAIRGSNNARAAQAFIDFVTSAAGQSTLVRFGFLRP